MKDDFENLFGASVAKHGNKVVSCAYREQFDGSYSAYKSNMGNQHFFHIAYRTINTFIGT